eukprot:scaffold194793_cov15-Tisochrysis_lutea.AAC.1
MVACLYFRPSGQPTAYGRWGGEVSLRTSGGASGRRLVVPLSPARAHHVWHGVGPRRAAGIIRSHPRCQK